MARPLRLALMAYFRKRLTPELLCEINEMVLRDAARTEEKKDDNDDNTDGGNCGTLTIDVTCVTSNIRYPQDVSLFNEARENAEKLLNELHDPADGKMQRNYRKRARKNYLKYARSSKDAVQKTKAAIRKQLGYLKRDMDAIDAKLSLGKELEKRQSERLDTLLKSYGQQK